MSEITMHREKRIRWNATGRRIAWFIHTPRFSVEFHIKVYKEPLRVGEEMLFHGEPCNLFAFEVHSRTPMYGLSQEPSHDDCTAVGGKCWHGGSSLAASEFFEWWDQSDEGAFRECESWARNRWDDHADPTPAALPKEVSDG